MSPCNHQQKCLINGICGIFDMKSNHVGKVIPKKPKVYKNWIRGRLNARNVFLKIDQKLHRYDHISGRRCLWSLRQMLSPGNDSWICWGYVYHRFRDFFHFASIAGWVCEFHFGTFRGNFKHYDWPHLIPCTNNNTACLILYARQGRWWIFHKSFIELKLFRTVDEIIRLKLSLYRLGLKINIRTKP